MLGVVKKVYVKSVSGKPVGKYKISWEGEMDEVSGGAGGGDVEGGGGGSLLCGR